MSLTNSLSKLDIKFDQELEDSLARLAAAPSDEQLLRSILYKLITNDRYQQALQLLNKYANELVLYKLYVYYKLQMDSEFEAALASAPKTRGVQHVEAQYYFQNGEFEKARELYAQLLAKNDSDSTSELLVNELTVAEPSASDDSYDYDYNLAHRLVANGKLQKAKAVLLQSLDKCDYEPDMANIKLELAMVSQLLHETKSSKQLLDEVSQHKLNDVQQYLLDNNTVSGDALQALKKLEFPNRLNSLKSKFTKQQFTELWNNGALLSLQAGKQVSPRGTYTELLSAISHCGIESLDELNMTKANKSFAFAKHHSTLANVLVAVHFNQAVGQFERCIQLLSLIEVWYAVPAVAGLVFALYEITGRNTDKIAVEAADYLLTLPELEYNYTKQVVLQLLKFDSSRASALVEKLEDKRDLVVLQDASQLRPVKELVNIDVSTLAGPTQKKAKKAAVLMVKKPKNKKKLPKGVDPERWLPLRDRSSYKKKNKKLTATQGGHADNTTENGIRRKRK